MTTPKTLEQKVEYLYDRALICDVVTRFFMALDRKAWREAGDCLTDPFTMLAQRSQLGDATLAGDPTPRAEFLDQLERRNGGFLETLHIHPNPVVTIAGETAHLTSFEIVPHSVGPDYLADILWSWGFYEIDLVRADGAWRMARLNIDGRIRNNVDATDIYRRAAERVKSRS